MKKETNSDILNAFSDNINAVIVKYNCSMMEAIVHFCEDTGLEIETVVPLVKSLPSIKQKLSMEAEDLNLLPKSKSRLPI